MPNTQYTQKRILLTAVKLFLKYGNKERYVGEILEQYYNLNKDVRFSGRKLILDKDKIKKYLHRCSWFDEKKGTYGRVYLMRNDLYDILKKSRLSTNIFEIQGLADAFKSLEKLIGDA